MVNQPAGGGARRSRGARDCRKKQGAISGAAFVEERKRLAVLVARTRANLEQHGASASEAHAAENSSTESTPSPLASKRATMSPTAAVDSAVHRQQAA